MSPPSSPTSPHEGEPGTRFSMAYKVIMTPVVFVSFLVSLVLVDLRYSVMRSHNHSDATSRMPRWLHSILYRGAPYRYVRVDRSKPDTAATGEQDANKWYYHTKQRKLMKLEADDAFRIRGSVLVVLGLLAVACSFMVWRVLCWLWAAVTTSHG